MFIFGNDISSVKMAKNPILTERKRAERALRDSQSQLMAELADARLLQSISNELINEGNVQGLSRKIIDAARRIMHSDFASLQIYYPERGNGGALHLMMHHGFDQKSAEFWEWVDESDGTSCAEALRKRQRVIVPEVTECDFIKGTEDYELFLKAGVHAVQTTPLISRSGRLLGMFTTHWLKPHQPSERDLSKLDVLARQASDLIERAQTEEALRESEERQAFLLKLSDALRPLADPIEIQSEAVRILGEHLDVSRVAYGEVSEADACIRFASNFVAPGAPDIVDSCQIADLGPVLLSAFLNERPNLVPEMATPAQL